MKSRVLLLTGESGTSWPLLGGPGSAGRGEGRAVAEAPGPPPPAPRVVAPLQLEPALPQGPVGRSKTLKKPHCPRAHGCRGHSGTGPRGRRRKAFSGFWARGPAATVGASPMTCRKIKLQTAASVSCLGLGHRELTSRLRSDLPEHGAPHWGRGVLSTKTPAHPTHLRVPGHVRHAQSPAGGRGTPGPTGTAPPPHAAGSHLCRQPEPVNHPAPRRLPVPYWRGPGRPVAAGRKRVSAVTTDKL